MRLPFRQAVSMLLVAFILNCFQAARVSADENGPSIEKVRQDWAVLKYKTDRSQQVLAFEALNDYLDTEMKQNPNNPSLLAWRGTVLSTYANLKGGLGAVKILEEAKGYLEQSIALDDTAEQGLAHVILGALYYKAPGWPISFKDNKEAIKHLEKGLTLNPNGIDANYFYGDYWKEQGDKEKAREYLSAVLKAPVRENNVVADEGRRQEAEKALQAL
jgi:tetratricopeptide (TPR) repeat protein